MNPNNIQIDPLNPEASLQAYLDKANQHIDYFEKDDGRIVVFKYKGGDKEFAERLSMHSAYAMIRPARNESAVLDVMDVWMSDREGPEAETTLQQFKDEGFVIAGYVDNRYVDIFGLVRPDPPPTLVETPDGNKVNVIRKRNYENREYMTPDEASDARDRWWSEELPTLEQAKQPFINVWRNFKANIEKLQQQDWTEVKEQAKITFN